MTMPRSICNLCTLAAALAMALPAAAVVVPAGTTVALPGTTAAADPTLAGLVLEDELIDFSLPVSQTDASPITGVLQQRVVRSSATGTLDFYWRVRDLQGGALGYVRVGQFAAPVFDADWRIDSLGDVGPARAHRFAAGEHGLANDHYANFEFVDAAGADTLLPGQASKFMMLRTGATQYARTAFIDVASHDTRTMSASFGAFAPAVPEPGTWLLMACGAAGLALRPARRARV